MRRFRRRAARPGGWSAGLVVRSLAASVCLIGSLACGGTGTQLGGNADDATGPDDGPADEVNPRDADAPGPDDGVTDTGGPDDGPADEAVPDGGDGDAGEAGTDAWIPPLEDAGDVGWRDSGTPWVPPVAHCDDPMFASTPLDLWSDPSGVYLLYGWLEADETTGGYAPLLAVWRNQGGGWTEFARGAWDGCGPECDVQLGGFIDGWLVASLAQGTVYGFAPGVVDTRWPELTSVAANLFVVNEGLAYLSWQAGRDARIVRWNGTAWSAIPAALPFSEAYQARLWADEDDLFVAGPYAILLSLASDGWVIHDAGTIANFTSIWGFGGDDVWVGGAAGVLKHYDGVSWSGVDWPSRETPSTCVEQTSIHAMWGADGVLYFVTATQFARWDGTRVEVLGYWPDRWVPDGTGGTCVADLRLVALWGNSPTEVFLLVARPGAEPSTGYCNDIAVLRWDGMTMHRM
jgi:hypothetical protein